MLKKFEVENFKNFKNRVTIDLQNTSDYRFNEDCIYNGLISKMIMYGRNATGKSNLGRAVMDICYLLFSTNPDPRRYENEVFLNADSESGYATFKYTFQFGSDELIYEYTRFSRRDMRSEKMCVNSEPVFDVDFINKDICYPGLGKVNAETVNVERYKQYLHEVSDGGDDGGVPKSSFLKWITDSAALDADSIIMSLYGYIDGMMIISANITERFSLFSWRIFFKSLSEKEKLEDFEAFLNMAGFNCGLALKELPDGKHELYFNYKHKLVQFNQNASSGTRVLFYLYVRLVSRSKSPSLIYFDEYDAFYHYEMAENIIGYLKQKFPRMQIIFTTHNTGLMSNRLMRPDCLFILSGEGLLTPLSKATQRELREGHNLEKMYINGEFAKYE